MAALDMQGSTAKEAARLGLPHFSNLVRPRFQLGTPLTSTVAAQ